MTSPSKLPHDPTVKDLARSQEEMHECLEEFKTSTNERLDIAKADREKIAVDLTKHIEGVVEHRVTSRNQALTIIGQLRASSDQNAMASDLLNKRVDDIVSRQDKNGERMDKFGEQLLAIGARVGAGKEGELKPLSLGKIVSVAVTAGGAVGAFLLGTLKALHVIH